MKITSRMVRVGTVVTFSLRPHSMVVTVVCTGGLKCAKCDDVNKEAQKGKKINDKSKYSKNVWYVTNLISIVQPQLPPPAYPYPSQPADKSSTA